MHRSLIAALAALIGIAVPAGAIDLTNGKVAKLKNRPDTDDQAIIKVVKDVGIAFPVPNPACPTGSSIHLRTNLHDIIAPLDCTLWTAKGLGYAYSDPLGFNGGVQKVQVKPGPNGGKLLIKVRGPNYGANSIAGPINFLEVRLNLGATEYCARFQAPTSTFKKNQTDQVLIKGPSQACAPLSTPTVTVTRTVTMTPTQTNTLTSTATRTSTPTLTPTVTVPPGSTATSTGTPTATPTPTLNLPPTIFRIDSLNLRDPHAFISLFGGPCNEATDPPGIFGLSVNGLINSNITDDSEPDGVLDLSILTIFRPLVQVPTAGSVIEIRTGDCTPPHGSEGMCSPGANPSGPLAPYSNPLIGPCSATVPGTTGPGNSGSYAPGISVSDFPCLATNPVDITFPFGVFTIPLQNVQASAEYVGLPATSLIDGTLVGFLSETAANAILLPPDLPFVGGQPLSSFLPGGAGSCAPHDDRDTGPGPAFESGWYFYLNFTAHQVPWSGS